MEAFAVGNIVLVTFPFSDLTQAKLRPAVVLADVGRDDWILAQITSKPYGDVRAITMTEADFEQGSLRRVSYVRPGKLFTANRSLIVSTVGTLKSESFNAIIEAVVNLLRSSKRKVT